MASDGPAALGVDDRPASGGPSGRPWRVRAWLRPEVWLTSPGSVKMNLQVVKEMFLVREEE